MGVHEFTVAFPVVAQQAFLDEQAGDEKAAEDEEDVDAEKAGRNQAIVKHEDEQDRDAALADARRAFGGPVQWAVQDETVAA